MIQIETFQCNMLQENAYIVYDETGEGVAIDCGAYYDEERQAVVDFVRKHNITLKHVLCTHGHLDHCFGNDTLFSEFGLKPELHADDEFLAKDLARQASDLFGMAYRCPTPPIGRFIGPGDVISFGTHQFEILHTPGHTPGGITFYCKEEAIAFTGDTLFRMSIGRTDFERGSWPDMLNSLQQVLSSLPPNTVVYPGHGPKTTIGEEVKMNPYFK